ncbi:BnaA08g11730D [Brassica napus]|uniref:BnaA08g11730D protein n=1 Tax=Brassica napus TaxID=3708 RepID=A0A078ILH6_BRANA|nr:BnaA08g11730D [Brassica napus]
MCKIFCEFGFFHLPVMLSKI